MELDGEGLTPEAVARIARTDAPVVVPESARESIRRARERITDVLATDEPVYGVTTGFGDLVDERVERDRLDDLQHNLVRSHAAGTGRELAPEEVRALLATRCNALAVGHSGVRERVVDRLVDLLNVGIHPVVRSRGSLGASGDLAPLAHAALVLIGEGEADVAPELVGEPADADPVRLPGDEALAAAGLAPLTLAPKEGLALINGTQLTVGLAALAVVDAERLVRTADVAGALTTEVAMGTTVNCDAAIQSVRPHVGQAASARAVRRITAGSTVLDSHADCDRVQDAYSVRCLPQVHGAARDAVAHLREAVTVELNSATDNPLVFDADRADDRASGTGQAAIVSGGNFHGAPLAGRLDYLVGSLTSLASICERRIDRLLNPHHQERHLPPYLARDPGVSSGLMIAQYTAAALVSDLRQEGRAGTATTTPVSGGQEDHVSQSATAAMAVRRAVERATTVVGIELLCATEARAFVDDDLSLGAGTRAAHDAVRSVVPPVTADRRLDGDIDRAAALVAGGFIEERVREAIDEPLP
ncbi:histidine ammonia-lyase [Halobacteriales archaeon SW_7_68_16]|nr:MAG: histidine ammonia-lyase [Halobacteriales archaeon SW_7_68_16]